MTNICKRYDVVIAVKGLYIVARRHQDGVATYYLKGKYLKLIVNRFPQIRVI